MRPRSNSCERLLETPKCRRLCVESCTTACPSPWAPCTTACPSPWAASVCGTPGIDCPQSPWPGLPWDTTTVAMPMLPDLLHCVIPSRNPLGDISNFGGDGKTTQPVLGNVDETMNPPSTPRTGTDSCNGNASISPRAVPTPWRQPRDGSCSPPPAPRRRPRDESWSPPPAPRHSVAPKSFMATLRSGNADSVYGALSDDPMLALIPLFEHDVEPPLCAAVRLGCGLKVVKHLLDFKADVNMTTIRGQSPLLLLSARPLLPPSRAEDISPFDSSTNDMLYRIQLAAAQESERKAKVALESARLLMAAGADPFAEQGSEISCLEAARIAGNTALMQLFASAQEEGGMD